MKVMFICTGNTCRSVMAKAIFEKILAEEGIKNIEVYSSGIYAEDGDGPAMYAIETMKEINIDITGHRSINIKKSKIEEMDIILCSTLSQKLMVLQMYPNLKNNIFTIKEYANKENENEDLDIKDPWGYDLTIYRKCANELKKYLKKIANKL